MRVLFTRQQIRRIYGLASFIIVILVFWLVYLGRGQPSTSRADFHQLKSLHVIAKDGEAKIVAPAELAPKYTVDRKLDEAQKQEYSVGYSKIGFNKFASDRIPIARKVPETRNPKCLDEPIPFYWKSTLKTLPTLGVVIPVRNEPRSTLLRTVTSILKRTPERLLKEIILHDVSSDFDETIGALKEAEKLSPKVKVVRHIEPNSNINNARAIGMNAVTADVIFTTDAHVEVNHGWAEPLLYHLSNKSSEYIFSPTLDIIDKDTFQYLSIQPIRPTYVIGFNFFLDTLPLPNNERQETYFRNSYLPMKEPAVGVHFAIRRKFYHKIGGINSNLLSGGDVEISFKAWLCGDGIYRTPCSRIGHIDRDPVLSQDADSKLKKDEAIVERSKLAKIWMGDYANLYCSRFKPHLCKDIQVHTDMMKDRVKCKRFESYLSDAAFMVFIPNELEKHGQVINKAHRVEVCLTQILWQLTGLPTVQTCLPTTVGRSQYFMLTKTGELRQDNGCLEFDFDKLQKMKCKTTLAWKYEDSMLKHMASNKCLTRDDKNVLQMQDCKQGDEKQTWAFKAPTE